MHGLVELESDFRKPENFPAENLLLTCSEVRWNTLFFQKGFEPNNWSFLIFNWSPINSSEWEERVCVGRKTTGDSLSSVTGHIWEELWSQ
jgi:hypothetical protein